MIRRLRRACLPALAILAPLFAWGCGPEPTWRRFLGETYQNWVFPGDAEVQSVGSVETDGARMWRVLDATTGATKRQLRLSPGVDPRGLLPNGAMLASSQLDGDHLLFSADLAKPPRRLRRPEAAGERVYSHVDTTCRWLMASYDAMDRSERALPLIAIYDLEADSPPRIFDGMGRGMFLADGRHAVLDEADPVNARGVKTGKPMRRVCVDLKTGARLWEATLPDEYSAFYSVPEKHWIVFRRIVVATAMAQPDATVLDDRTGETIANWGDSYRTISQDGLVVESIPWSRFAQVHGDGFRRTIDLGYSVRDRLFWIAKRRGGERCLQTLDRTPIFDFRSVGLKSLFGCNSVQRLAQREWNLETGELLVSAVQYRGDPNDLHWNGIASEDGSFEIQTCDLFGLKWLQRVERPARRNIPLRIALGAAPAVLLLALRLRRRARFAATPTVRVSKAADP